MLFLGVEWLLLLLRCGGLQGALAIEEVEEVALVGLVPVDFIGGDGAQVEAFYLGGREQIVDQLFVFGEGRNH